VSLCAIVTLFKLLGLGWAFTHFKYRYFYCALYSLSLDITPRSFHSLFLQFSAHEGRSLLCFEEVVLEDQQAVTDHYALQNGISWEETASQGKLLVSSLDNPKSAPMKGLYSAI